MNDFNDADTNQEVLRSASAVVGYYRGLGTEGVEDSAADEKARLSGQFDPALSYSETRGAFERDFEQRYVSWLLSRHAGNISAAAREARMDRKHLHDLAKKHGLRGQGAAGRR